MKSILWISARLPAPLFSGDAIYSAGLIEALARTEDASIFVVGLRRDELGSHRRLAEISQITCIDLPAGPPSRLMSLASSLPKDAFGLATPELQQTVSTLLEREWDWIVIDHAYSAGVLPIVEQKRQRSSICYVAHNAEGKIRPEVAKGFKGVRRTIMAFDAEKYRRLEKRVLAAADLTISITDEDSKYFYSRSRKTIVIPPVYLGAKTELRTITTDCPREITLIGSFEWVAKQRNLEEIVGSLMPTLDQHDVTLSIVGSVPEALAAKLSAQARNLKIHGRVADFSTVANRSRGGLVAEVLGGGFKLKLLDYAFARMPIFGLEDAVSGMTDDEKSSMALTRHLDELGNRIVADIGNEKLLNERQSRLYELTSKRFGFDEISKRLATAFVQPHHPQ